MPGAHRVSLPPGTNLLPRVYSGEPLRDSLGGLTSEYAEIEGTEPGGAPSGRVASAAAAARWARLRAWFAGSGIRERAGVVHAERSPAVRPLPRQRAGELAEM